MNKLHFLLIATCVLFLTACKDGAQRLESGFRDPASAGVQTSAYWYWISGNVSAEGVVADLEAMKQIGIDRAFIGNIGLPESEMPHRGPVRLFSDEWYGIVHTALKRATELDMEIGMFNCPGWSQAGGPWIEPEESMRYLATVCREVQGGGLVKVALPASSSDFEDVGTIAVPLPPGVVTLDASTARIGGSPDARKAVDGDRTTALVCGSGCDAVIEVMPLTPFTLRAVRIHPIHVPILAEAELLAIRDGRTTVLRRFTIDRTNPSPEVGFDPYAPITIACDPTEADAFRLVVSGAAPGSGLAEVEFSSLALVERYSEKSLAKMHQTPLPYWHDYMWTRQPADMDPVAAIAPDAIVDISAFRSGDQVRWEAPAGRWMILRMGMLPTGVKNGPALDDGIGLEVDKWSREHLAEHYDAFVGELCRRIPPADRRSWKVIVADSYEKGGQNFSDDFFENFEKRYGYDARPYLPVFSGYSVGDRDRSDRFLWDLRRMMADRLAYDHIGALRELAHRDGFTTWLENYGHWGFPGEFLQYGGQSDEVAGEFWSEGDLGNIENRAASSCAHIYGKNKVSSESFTAAFTPFARYPYRMKQRADRFFSEGINNTLLHVCISQPADNPKPGMNAFFGNEFNRNNTWFGQLDLFIAYLKRCNFMLQQGLNVADVAYFIGEDVPKMTGVCDPALPIGYQFDYINAEMLCRDATVRDGKLTLPHGTQYRVLVLPRQETMRPEVLKRIRQLVWNGAVVLGPAPTRSPSLEDYPAADVRVRTMANELWGSDTGKIYRHYGRGMIFDGYTLEELFDELQMTPDCRYDASLPLLYGHRTTDDAEIYFISNQSEEPIECSVAFRVTGRCPEWWQPATGTIRELPAYRAGSAETEVPMRLFPLESGFVVFRKKSGDMSAGSDSPDTNFPLPEVVATLDDMWTVSFEAPDGIGNFSIVTDTLGDWSRSDDDRLRYFSGTASYRMSFEDPAFGRERILLDLNRVSVMAKVWMNGEYVGGVWAPPYRLDVTDFIRPGRNELKIEVVNTWVNRLVGDSRFPETRTTWAAYDPYTPDSPLQESGLIGPVTLQTVAW